MSYSSTQAAVHSTNRAVERTIDPLENGATYSTIHTETLNWWDRETTHIIPDNRYISSEDYGEHTGMQETTEGINSLQDVDRSSKAAQTMPSTSTPTLRGGSTESTAPSTTGTSRSPDFQPSPEEGRHDGHAVLSSARFDTAGPEELVAPSTPLGTASGRQIASGSLELFGQMERARVSCYGEFSFAQSE